MAGCFELGMKFLYFDLYKIELPPESSLNKIYKYEHDMLYSRVMKQLKTYKLNTVFIVSLDFLEYGYFDVGGVRTPCFDFNSIDATSYQTRCLMNNDFDGKWVRGFGSDF